MKRNNRHSSPGMDRKIWWVSGFSLTALILFVGILYQQKLEQKKTSTWVNHTNEVIRNIDTISNLLSETESASGVYLATNHTGSIKQLHDLELQISRSLSELQLLTSDNAAQQANIQKLQALFIQKKMSLEKKVSRSFSSDTSTKKTGTGDDEAQITNNIRQQLISTRSIENRLLSARILENEDHYKTSINTALFGGIFAFVLVLLILFELNRDISRRRIAEEDILINEEKYRKLIENAGTVMYTTDSTGLIGFSNKRVTELTGYEVEELRGKHFSILLNAEWKEKLVRFYTNQLLTKTPASQLEFTIQTKNGEQKWVEQSSQLLYDDNANISGFQCMVKDITEKKQIQQELDESESARKENEYRLNAILNNTSTLIFIKDLTGRYVMVNQQFKNVFNLTDEMVINKTDYDFNSHDQAERYLTLDKEVMTTRKPVQLEETIETAGGTRTLLLVKFPLLDDKQNVFGISGIATDITETIKQRRELQDALKNAEEAKELQEQFLANMSHEIRTPLNGIQGMTTLLLETKLDTEQLEFASTINRSLHNLLSIVNNILDFSNIKTGKLPLLKKPFSVREVIEDIKKQFEHQIKNKGLVLELMVHDKIPVWVTGDAARLKQVLVNLVDNAVKFTEKGQIRIEVFLVGQSPEDVKLSFSVIDTGIGIASDKFETIFKSFAQANIDISQGYGGAGLGLAISKGLIELMGGNISVLSQLNNGSVFRFIISYGIAEQNDEGPVDKNDPLEQLRNKHFLVVEDNPVNQRLISFVLQKVGGRIDMASNGKEAIELLKAKTDYDLILMDIQMPVMGGYETTEYIRKELRLQTPIIALTATALKEDQDKCIEVGMNDYILKPFDFKDLYSRLTRLLLHRPALPQITVLPQTVSVEKLYDLSLLEELENKRYVYDMILFFLESSPADIVQLTPLVEKQDWDALQKVAHKVKGAAGMMQSTRITALLARIEAAARERIQIDQVPVLVKEVVMLFAELEKQLRIELDFIKKQLSESD